LLVAYVSVKEIEARIRAQVKKAVLPINQTVDDSDVRSHLKQPIA